MAGSLEFINQTEVTSGVTTIDVDNVFSADYDVYYCQIVGLYHNVNVSNGVEGIRLIDSGGSVISASEYDNATLVLKADTTFQEVRNTSNSYMNMYLITDQNQMVQVVLVFIYIILMTVVLIHLCSINPQVVIVALNGVVKELQYINQQKL